MPCVKLIGSTLNQLPKSKVTLNGNDIFEGVSTAPRTASDIKIAANQDSLHRRELSEICRSKSGMHPVTSSSHSQNNPSHVDTLHQLTPANSTLNQPAAGQNHIETGFYVSEEEDYHSRPRSHSFHNRTHNSRLGLATSPQNIGPLSRFTAENRMGRTGSADNLAPYPPIHNRLTHSNTISEIPPYRDALSNDSGYHTPPCPRPQTSPLQTHNQLPSWSAPVSMFSPPPGTVSSHAHSQWSPAAHRIPTDQKLTIDTGHFEEEPNGPQLMVSECMPQSLVYYPQSSVASYTNVPHSLHSQRSQSRNIIEYQKERHDRLIQAYRVEEAALTKLEDEIKSLELSLESESAESGSNAGYSVTEEDVESLRKEHHNIKDSINKLKALLVNLQSQRPVAPVPTPPPIQAPVVTPPPRPDITGQWSCVKCTYNNHALINFCEMCDAPRPPRGSPTDSNSSTHTGLVRTSSCTHQSGCFCHAHLG